MDCPFEVARQNMDRRLAFVQGLFQDTSNAKFVRMLQPTRKLTMHRVHESTKKTTDSSLRGLRCGRRGPSKTTGLSAAPARSDLDYLRLTRMKRRWPGLNDCGHGMLAIKRRRPTKFAIFFYN